MRARLINPHELGEAANDGSLAARWEALVKLNPASGFMQSLKWAKFKRSQDMTPVHIGLFEDQVLTGGAIFYTADLVKGTGFMVAPDGPVLPWHDESRCAEGLRLIVECAEAFACENRQIAIRIQPRVKAPTFLGEYEFGRAPVDLTPRETLFLDLTQPTEMLLAAMKPKTRYNLKLANKKGVEVFEDYGPSALNQVHELMQEAAGRDGFYLEPPAFFEALVQMLLPENNLRLFFARNEGQLLGTLMMLVYGGRATYLYGGISNVKRSLMPGYALQWAAIRTAQQMGASEYDFYGFDQLQSPLNTYARFSRFKSGFGGTPIRYIGAHDYFFLDTLTDAIVKAVSEVEWDEDEENLTEAAPMERGLACFAAATTRGNCQ